MQTTFENLYFSFLIDSANGTAYLQEWEDGEWSEPEVFPVPVALDGLPKKSRLARAVRSLSDASLRDSLEAGLARQPAPERRSLFTRIADLIYAS